MWRFVLSLIAFLMDVTSSDSIPLYANRTRSIKSYDTPEFMYTVNPELFNTRLPFATDNVPLVRLTRDILAQGKYDVRVRPVIDHQRSLSIHISMSLYQIIEVNEPAQNIKMNVWMIQKWRDEMLDWDPREYDMINSTILPHEALWIPDTYLFYTGIFLLIMNILRYNSVVMSAEETERYMNIRADSLFWEGKKGANMSFLYPAIYTITCRLNIRYFPYDQQNCTLTISSWTNSKSALDYYADEYVNMASYIHHEEWHVKSFKVYRHEYKYACCPEPWVILEASIVLRRKPLYYVVNLIIPTSIITVSSIVAITGFFTPASTADDRTEKINLGITTLLAMSILMLMVSDQMPTTSEFVPLIAWFYLSTIIIISIGTFMTSVILSIQGRRKYGKLPPTIIRYIFFVRVTEIFCVSIPLQLRALWEELNDEPYSQYIEWKNKTSQTKSGIQESNLEPASKVNRHVVRKRSSLLRSGFSERARLNWLRVAAIIREYNARTNRDTAETIWEEGNNHVASNEVLDATGTERGSLVRRPSLAERQWAHTISLLINSNGPSSRRRSDSFRGEKSPSARNMISAEVVAMKKKRQCSLEWEFLATILDRLFLIIFVFTVIFVTAGVMATGLIAQYQYGQAIDESN